MADFIGYNDSYDRNLERIDNIAKTIYHSIGLRCIVYDNSKFTLTGDELNEKYEEIIYSSLMELPKKIHRNKGDYKHKIFIFSGKYNLNYFVFLPSKTSVLNSPVVIGPYLSNIIDEHFINKLLHNDVNLNNRDTLKNLYSTLHFFEDSKVYYNKKFIELMLSNDELDNAFYDNNTNYEIPSLASEIVAEDDLTNPTAANDIIKTEKVFFEYLLQGNVEKVISIYKNDLRSTFLVPNSKNPLRTAKNRAIAFIGIISRKMIKGGISAEKAIAHEMAYVELIERSSSLIQLSESMEALILNAVTSVIKLNNIEHINIIIQVTKYVSKHLSEPIRLPDVAAHVGLSPNYFSSLFKKEMKISFADYVNKVRIKESQHLLKTSDFSILDIAIAVGYSNQNYFTTMFKRFTNNTPKQYRLKNL